MGKKKSMDDQKLLKKISGFSTLKGYKSLTTEDSTKKKIRRTPRNIQKIMNKRNKQKSKSIMN